ncbi:hypothetical protein HanOQP8_Chr17g0679521 [Helianthus annuus]|nr:hypothetical protein HanHA89_Chr17g0726601 [Helianthus annuus]KAJ0637927.1 hypothetical protein HanOQP8_Chr17g0679521 [Helianthus annuus]
MVRVSYPSPSSFYIFRFAQSGGVGGTTIATETRVYVVDGGDGGCRHQSRSTQPVSQEFILDVGGSGVKREVLYAIFFLHNLEPLDASKREGVQITLFSGQGDQMNGREKKKQREIMEVT